jgi:hypothetical protein
VEAFRVVLSWSAVLLLAANLAGQGVTSTWITGLLPPEAKVMETADLEIGGRNSRGLVLWMLHPTRVVRQESGDLGCADWAYGDHWYGPTRLSLFDVTNKRLINTIEIRGMYEGAGEMDHGFPIPFLVPNGSYYVPHVGSNKEGAPIILNLRDLTGEGVAGQFVLFEYEACAISDTARNQIVLCSMALKGSLRVESQKSFRGLSRFSEQSPFAPAIGTSPGNLDTEPKALSTNRFLSIRKSRFLYNSEALRN